MVAPIPKNINALLNLIVSDVIFGMLEKPIIGDFSRFFEGASTFLTPKLPFAALRTIWGSEKSWPPRKTPRNGRLCVLPA